MPLPDVLLSVSENSITKSVGLLQGTLNLLILEILELEHLHGWVLAQRVKQMSNDVIQVGSSRTSLWDLSSHF
jgi:hypothetical protein